MRAPKRLVGEICVDVCWEEFFACVSLLFFRIHDDMYTILNAERGLRTKRVSYVLMWILRFCDSTLRIHGMPWWCGDSSCWRGSGRLGDVYCKWCVVIHSFPHKGFVCKSLLSWFCPECGWVTLSTDVKFFSSRWHFIGKALSLELIYLYIQYVRYNRSNRLKSWKHLYLSD